MASVHTVIFSATDVWLMAPDFAGAAAPKDAEAINGWLSIKEFVLAVLVAMLGMVTLWMQHTSLRRSGKADASEFTKSSVLILVIMSAMFTVVAGISDVDVAPIMGLFGTIVGYVIGARTPTNPASKNDVKSDVEQGS